MTVTSSPGTGSRPERAARCLGDVVELLERIREARRARLADVNRVAPRHRHSALNLVDYTDVRS